MAERGTGRGVGSHSRQITRRRKGFASSKSRLVTMNKEDWPQYMISKSLSGGRIGYYWNPAKRIMDKNPPLERKPLGQDLPAAIIEARQRTNALKHWLLTGHLPDETPSETAELPGSIDHMFRVYREHAPSKQGSFESLKNSTKRDYNYHISRFSNYVLKDGRRIGEVLAKDIDPPFVDTIYEKFAHNDKGEPILRSANMMMAVCRRAWQVAHRAMPERVPTDNPFSKMGLNQSSTETRPATYEELVTFETKALELNRPELAFAARAAWELLQRPSEIRDCFAWKHYRPPEHPNEVWVGFNKNKNPIWKPLEDEEGRFYPELEDYLKLIPQRSPIVCTHEVLKGRQKSSGVFKPYSKRFFEKSVKMVAVAAGLPHITLAKFRHGGLTELGDAKLPDTLAQALSRHKQRSTLDRYIHSTNEQALTASRQRLDHRNKRDAS